MHRQWREQTILACLDEGIGTIPQIVEKLYGGLERELKEAAALSVLAHLDHLIERELVTRERDLNPLAASYARPSSKACA
jgi:hypothetical protein